MQLKMSKQIAIEIIKAITAREITLILLYVSLLSQLTAVR